MGLTIRYATQNDIDSLALIHSASLQAAYADIFPEEVIKNSFSFERRKAGFERELLANRPFNAIAFSQGLPVGLLSLGESRHIEVTKNTIELWRIYLHPDFWGSGYGEVLLKWGLSEAKDMGYKRVILWALEKNARARHFYEKMGFGLTGNVMEEEVGIVIKELLYSSNIDII